MAATSSSLLRCAIVHHLSRQNQGDTPSGCLPPVMNLCVNHPKMCSLSSREDVQCAICVEILERVCLPNKLRMGCFVEATLASFQSNTLLNHVDLLRDPNQSDVWSIETKLRIELQRLKAVTCTCYGHDKVLPSTFASAPKKRLGA